METEELRRTPPAEGRPTEGQIRPWRRRSTPSSFRGMAVVEMERRGSTAIIRFNRPEARNAISPEVSETMVGILDEIEADAGLRVAVLTGTGEVFSAGADLKVVAQGRAADIARVKGGFAGVVTRDFPKPLIAAPRRKRSRFAASA